MIISKHLVDVILQRSKSLSKFNQKHYSQNTVEHNVEQNTTFGLNCFLLNYSRSLFTMLLSLSKLDLQTLKACLNLYYVFRCTYGTMNLQASNPYGCTACFCFGQSSVCEVASNYTVAYIVSEFDDGTCG